MRPIHPPAFPRPDRSRSAYTLMEIMVAMTILLLAMGITMVAFLSVLKRAVHSEKMLKGATELRYATDYITQVMRSAPQTPVVSTGGLQLLVAPANLGYATVLGTTWIDSVHNVRGSKSNQRMLHLSNVTPVAVVASIFRSTARPAGALASADVSIYFKDSSTLPVVDLNDLFASGDTLTIPSTVYGQTTTGVINNISNNSGNKTLTLTANLGVDVPDGTKIPATAGRRLLFEVRSGGDLRCYPDSRDLTKFFVLARDIDPAPLSVPSNTASARTVPFVISGRYLTLNLQQLPTGTAAGRTVQGVQTTAFTRTDPLLP
ncbi:MAG: prepilin-type N-terminal cleavage/methylation domain-containing protein [Undibacterium sp.]|nr:prepilin-type N-terminal cleavage/methylation domain-containing protein [Opitutaceae bacterium]